MTHKEWHIKLDIALRRLNSSRKGLIDPNIADKILQDHNQHIRQINV